MYLIDCIILQLTICLNIFWERTADLKYRYSTGATGFSVKQQPRKSTHPWMTAINLFRWCIVFHSIFHFHFHFAFYFLTTVTLTLTPSNAEKLKHASYRNNGRKVIEHNNITKQRTAVPLTTLSFSVSSLYVLTEQER